MTACDSKDFDVMRVQSVGPDNADFDLSCGESKYISVCLLWGCIFEFNRSQTFKILGSLEGLSGC